MSKFESNAVTWFEIPTTDFERATHCYESVLDVKLHAFPGPELCSMFPIQENGVGGCIVYREHQKPAADGSLVGWRRECPRRRCRPRTHRSRSSPGARQQPRRHPDVCARLPNATSPATSARSRARRLRRQPRPWLRLHPPQRRTLAAHRAPSRPLLLEWHLDARRLVRAAQRLPHLSPGWHRPV
jgi:hypothetical protein